MAGSDEQSVAETPVDVALCMGAEVYSRLWEVVRHLCVGLIDLAARVRLLSSSPEVEELSLGPIQTITHQGLVWPLRRKRLQQVLDMLAPRPPGVVHAISADSFAVAEGIARAYDVQLLLHLTSWADVAALANVDGQKVDHVIAGSRPLFEAAERQGRVDPEALTLIRPGVLRPAAPPSFGQPECVPAVLCTAELREHGGVDRLIRAVRILRDRGRELLLFLLGTGPDEGELRRLARGTGVADWVTFARPKADKSQIMSGADVFVEPSVAEALSSTSLQAMASGTVVVACAGGVTDHCIDGRTAIVCPDNAPTALADGIERLLADHDYARRLAAAGIEHIQEHHLVSTMAEQCMLLYRRLDLRHRTFSLEE